MTYPANQIADALGISDTTIHDIEVRFVNKIFQACRSDSRYDEQTNLEILSSIQQQLGASLPVVAQAAKRYNIIIERNDK